MSRSMFRRRGRVVGSVTQTSAGSSSYLVSTDATRRLNIDRLNRRSWTERFLKLGILILATIAMLATVIAAPGWAVFIAIISWIVICVLLAADDTPGSTA